MIPALHEEDAHEVIWDGIWEFRQDIEDGAFDYVAEEIVKRLKKVAHD